MRLSSLTLERVRLALVLWVRFVGLAGTGAVLLDELVVFCNSLLIELVKSANCELDIGDKAIATTLAEVLADDYAHEFQGFGMRSHGVSRNDPATFAEIVGNGKLIISVMIIRVQAECNQWQSLSTSLRHDDKAELLQIGRKVIRSSGKIRHDGSVTTLSETDQLIVLADDLRSTLREVERERGLLSAQVIDVENQFLGKEFR